MTFIYLFIPRINSTNDSKLVKMLPMLRQLKIYKQQKTNVIISTKLRLNLSKLWMNWKILLEGKRDKGLILRKFAGNLKAI